MHFTFSGRASRSKFWFSILYLSIANIVLSVIDSFVWSIMHIEPLSNLFYLATLIPCIWITARRLHDGHQSGWWQIAVRLFEISAVASVVT